MGGILVLANIHLHGEVGPPIIVTFWNATDTIKPSIIPKAVHICHIMVNAPRIVFGADSAAYTGVVDDFAPTAKPSINRAMRRFTPTYVSVYTTCVFLSDGTYSSHKPPSRYQL